MSYRYGASYLDPGLNTLVAPTPSYTYNLYAWGKNTQGNLGLSNITNYSSPKQVGSLTNWSFLSAGYAVSIGIKTDGTLWIWGYNIYGQLAQGNTASYSSPKQVGALTNWSSAATSGFHTLAVKTDGTLWAWGLNNSGQLGTGNVSNYSSPKQIGALTNWLSVSAGYTYISGSSGFSLAVKTDGTLWSWGQNGSGQLGLGNTNNYSSPKQIGALTTWSKISAFGIANASSLAIKTDGTLWGWGISSIGQLGLNNTTSYSSPKQIGGLTNWLLIAGGGYSSFAIKTDGTFWSWGYNNDGQLGQGNVTSLSSPKQVGSLTNWLSVSAGFYHVVSSKKDGTFWSCGANNLGQLGLGNTTYYSSPKQVGSSVSWKSPTAGSYHTLGLQY